MLSYRPLISESIIIRAERPLQGDIKLGEVFAWRPDMPHARELCIVSEIVDGSDGERLIYTYDMEYVTRTMNDESLFREACYRTTFNLFPAYKPSVVERLNCKPQSRDWYGMRFHTRSGMPDASAYIKV